MFSEKVTRYLCLSEIVRENYLLSVRIPNRYSDNFGIPKFRIPIDTSSSNHTPNFVSIGPAISEL